MDKFLSLTIPTKVEMDHARRANILLKLRLIKLPKFHNFQLMPLRLPSLTDQPLSPLRLIDLPSKDTEVESSILKNAVPTSITPSLVSDMDLREDKITTSSETHGVEAGESKVTLESPPSQEDQRVSVVSNKNPSGPLLTQHDYLMPLIEGILYLIFNFGYNT